MMDYLGELSLVEESRELTTTRQYRHVVARLSALPLNSLLSAPELGRDLAEAYLFLHRTQAGIQLTSALLKNEKTLQQSNITSQLRIIRAAFLSRGGQLAEAELLYQRVIHEVGWLKVSPLVAEAHNGLAIILGMKGEWESAITQLQRALILYQQLGNRRGVASVFHNIGLSNRYLDVCDEAERNFRHAYSYYFAEGTDEEKVFVEAERSLAILGMGDTDLAEVMAQRALRRCRDIQADEMCGDCLRIVGTVARENGKCSEAHAYLREGFEFAKKNNNRLLKAEIHEEFALSLLQLGKVSRAVKHRYVAREYYLLGGSVGHCRRLERRFNKLANTKLS
jgi:tetratricopeptide (TPR) repeat protein